MLKRGSGGVLAAIEVNFGPGWPGIGPGPELLGGRTAGVGGRPGPRYADGDGGWPGPGTGNAGDDAWFFPWPLSQPTNLLHGSLRPSDRWLKAAPLPWSPSTRSTAGTAPPLAAGALARARFSAPVNASACPPKQRPPDNFGPRALAAFATPALRCKDEAVAARLDLRPLLDARGA